MASSPMSPAKFATCSESSRRLQRLKRAASCSMVVCGSNFKTSVSPAATWRAFSASSTNSGTRSSIPIFPRRLRAIPGLCDSTPATRSSACSIAGKYRLVAASWLSRTKAALTKPWSSESCSTLSRRPRCRSALLSNLGSALAYNSAISESPTAVFFRASASSLSAQAAFGHRRPELTVENLAVRLDEQPGFAHLVFMSAENLSQVLDFLVHAVEHLPNGVDFHFAAFEALQRETDRQVFGQLHDHRLVRLGVRSLRRQACESLFQRILRAARQLRHLLLECTCRGHATLPCGNVPKARQRAENPIDLFFARLAMPAASASLSRTEPSTQRPGRPNSATSGYSRNRNGGRPAAACGPKACTRPCPSACSPAAGPSAVT